MFVASKPRTYALGAGATVLSLVAASGLVVAASAGEDSPLERQLQAEAQASMEQCVHGEASDGPGEVCLTGDITTGRKVMLVGDSKVYQWTIALAAAAAQTETKLLVRYLAACPLSPVSPDAFRIDAVGSARRGAEMADRCLDHRVETLRLIDEHQPDAVIVAESADYDATEEEWATALEALLTDIESTGARPALILDNPHLTTGAAECVKETGDPASCAPPFDEFVERTRTVRAAELHVLRSHPELPYYDAHSAICGESSCAMTTDGGLALYADRSHITMTFAFSQLDQLSRLIEQATR